jgi:uncharacterized membrane protein YhaH (DUF805 family)
MEANNPYQAPTADLDQTPRFGGIDETGVFSAKGRFGRLSYLAWSVVAGFATAFLIGVFAGIGILSGTELSPDNGIVANAVLVLLYLGSTIVSILFSIRRLHDLNRSGWWLLLSLIPLVNILFFLVLILWPGSKDGNNFGPPRITRTWEKVVGLLLPIVMIIGIIAAIAIPAYQGYMQAAARAAGG